MNGCGKSYGPIVPKNPANNDVAARLNRCYPRDTSAEQAEGRGPAKGNSLRGPEDRTQCRYSLYVALERIRQAAHAFGRYDPRQEPGAVVPHAGICPGGTPQGVSLPGSGLFVWRAGTSASPEASGFGLALRCDKSARQVRGQHMRGSFWKGKGVRTLCLARRDFRLPRGFRLRLGAPPRQVGETSQRATHARFFLNHFEPHTKKATFNFSHAGAPQAGQ